MTKFKKAAASIASVIAVTGLGAALYSCGSPASSPSGDMSKGNPAARDIFYTTYKIRGPKGWVDREFNKSHSKAFNILGKGYVLGTDYIVHIEHYWRADNDNLRIQLERGGITITDYYSTSKVGEYCYLEFNLKEIVEFKVKPRQWG
ncbi:hypothetical protein [Treponema endosymbiont of Eucomonympha sp.]|uniref:hypothetical protein n=1 Tax=Treponema endosymbiont of Eucomonympha sp. TaxID=1580831 RepID=UPI0007511D1F|nr:hypothetical protein [Treponema endosymbiont of Eucomonympha sp.]